MLAICTITITITLNDYANDYKYDYVNDYDYAHDHSAGSDRLFITPIINKVYITFHLTDALFQEISSFIVSNVMLQRSSRQILHALILWATSLIRVVSNHKMCETW